MDELRGPNIQIVLHVKEGLGFGFLKSPFVVTGSLNGYILETDPTVPCHGPLFDAELVWEADKRRFRNLRVQNVPIKVEVHTLGTQGKKDKVGYILLSLLGAQPCPANKIIDVKHTWHRLLGVKSEGKCCHPQLLLSLSIEDRISIPTPRNEMRMFHSNEVAYISSYSGANPATCQTMLATVGEYIAASNKTVTTLSLQPKLIADEGLIQIGDGKHHFILSFVIGAAENLHLLQPHWDANVRICCDCFVKYSVFSQDIKTDRVPALDDGCGNMTAHFNQKTSLRLRTDLSILSKYFTECPLVVVRLCSADKDFGICSIDLRKLFPTENLEEFLRNFCNDTMGLTIHERCFILPYEDKQRRDDTKRAFLDVEYSLKYVLHGKESNQRQLQGARSVTQLETVPCNFEDKRIVLEYKSGSCTEFDPEVGGVAYTNTRAEHSARLHQSGDAPYQAGREIAEIIKKMCDTFTESHERLLSGRAKAATSDMQVQCDPPTIDNEIGNQDGGSVKKNNQNEGFDAESKLSDCDKSTTPQKSETERPHIPYSDKDVVKIAIPSEERESIMKRFVEELEDWKEKQQELYTAQLKRKEEYHLDLLAKEWAKKRVELECKLSKGIEQCRNLANQLSVATEDLRMRPYRNSQREKKLIEAKSLLEQHYSGKLQELRDASVRMEQDMRAQVRDRDLRIDELEHKVQLLERQLEAVKKNLKNSEEEAENKYSGLTKDQTANLIQELRCLEEKVQSAEQAKGFFKEQWARGVRELHAARSAARRHQLARLHRQKARLGPDPTSNVDEEYDIEDNDPYKLKDDIYVDLLANTPGLESHSISASTLPGGFNMFSEEIHVTKSPLNEKLTALMSRRDALAAQGDPPEDEINALNQEIRNLLINCPT